MGFPMHIEHSGSDRSPDQNGSDPISTSASRLIGAIQRRWLFLGLIGSSDAAVILDILKTELASSVRFLRVGNPLAASLTINRIVLQLGGDFVNSSDEEAESMVRAVAGNDEGMPQTLLIIEQAETLDHAALRLLGMLPGLVSPGAPFIQILFVGGSGFMNLLEGEDLTEIREQLVDCSADEHSRDPWTALEDAWTLLFGSSSTAPPPQLDLPPRLDHPETEDVSSIVPERRIRRVLPPPLIFAAVPIVVAIGMAGILSQLPQSEPPVLSPPSASSRLPVQPAVSHPAAAGPVEQQTFVSPPVSSVPPRVELDPGKQTPIEPATIAVPSPETTEVSPGATAAISPTSPTPIVSDDNSLRNEFDLFLSLYRTDLGGLTAGQRETLFRQYVAHRDRR
jgi:hypothetical protein